jgi:multidrug efflux pump
VIAAGMAIGTMFTLFVVPMFYTFIAPREIGGVDRVPAPAPAGE